MLLVVMKDRKKVEAQRRGDKKGGKCKKDGGKKEAKEAQMEVGVEGHRPFRTNNMV